MRGASVSSPVLPLTCGEEELSVDVPSSQMKPLVLAGKLYIAVAPLYQLSKKGKGTVYAYTDAERDKILAQWGQVGVTIQRY
jgi:DNA gyrase/topoisomerase IV subunit B